MNGLIFSFLKKSIVLSLLLVIGFSISCENTQIKEAKIAKEKAETIERLKSYNDIVYGEDAVLLALKYNLDDDKVYNVLIDWNKPPFIHRLQNTKELIEMLSKKYEINTTLIANIILDYKKIEAKGSD